MSLSLPPEISTFLSLPEAKNPMYRLSGDQKGLAASSVPAIGCASEASNRLNQSCFWPLRMAISARNLPSGETAAGCVRLAQNPSPGGGRIAACNWDDGFTEGCRAKKMLRAMPRTATSAATRSQCRHARRLAASAGTVEELPEPETTSSAKARSEADWKRCSGFFSKQRCTTRCNPGGMFGVICERAGGSSFKIAVSVSTEVGFRNARFPDSISQRIAPKLNKSER